jgi:hypothetical protein
MEGWRGGWVDGDGRKIKVKEESTKPVDVSYIMDVYI